MHKYKWEDNIKMDVKEECEGVGGIHLAQGRGVGAGFCDHGNGP
jgi:hypothetical protein